MNHFESPKALDRLIDIVDHTTPFTSSDGQALVRVRSYISNEGYLFVPARSPAFRDYLVHQFYTLHDSLPSPQALSSILTCVEALARYSFRGQGIRVKRRISCCGPARNPTHILLDLANAKGQYVEISPESWCVTAGSSSAFETSRTNAALPIPLPPAGPGMPGDFDPLATLRACLNLSSQPDWLRVIAWLLSAFRPFGPYPFLIIQGPTGAGKSFVARLLRALIDPSTSSLTPLPSFVRHLHHLARHNWLLAFDHVSALSPSVADALCRLTSGLGVSVSETRGPASEPLQLSLKRPVLLTVTDRWTCPPDIAERALTITLPPLPPESRRPESELEVTFEEAYRRILGAICTAVGTALGRRPQLPPATGRLADTLAWAIAASPALGCTEDEMRAAFDPPAPVPPAPVHPATVHPMVEAVRNLLEQRQQWTGSATELLDLLGPALSRATPRVVSHQLRSCKLTLADSGIDLTFRRLHEGARIIDLRKDLGDANFQTDPEFASPDFSQPPQPTETEEVAS